MRALVRFRSAPYHSRMNALETTQLFTKFLRSLERCIDKAKTYAAERKFEADVLIHARLAPDQFAFARQVQAACDGAKLGAAKLAGKEPPSHPDTEKTLDELKERIHTVLAYLETFSAADFAGCDDRQVSHVWMQGRWIRGKDYMLEYAVPNFLFHVSHAYAILRNNGVPLGKADYLAPVPLQGERTEAAR
jgi:hypothetical protein